MKNFEEAKITIISFDRCDDIITTSGTKTYDYTSSAVVGGGDPIGSEGLDWVQP